MKKNKKGVKILKGEKMITFLILLTIVVGTFARVFTKAVLSETNISLEQIKAKISTQEGVNDSLAAQVDELASLDKIQEVATSKGMSYNNYNIKNINE